VIVLKRIVNLAVSLIVGFFDGLKSLFGGRKAPTCVVVAYHSVTEKERSRFEAQMDCLLRRTTPLRADVASLPSDIKAYSVVTFDDGFQNVVDNALPVLAERGIPATLFVVTEALGTARAWEHRGGDDTRDERVMSVEQMCALPADLVTIGSHTMNHLYLPSANQEQLEQEISGSRAKLEKMLNREVRLLSFPYGAFNSNVIQQCKKAGYHRVFTALPEFAFSEESEFATGRIGTAPTDWPIEFRLKLAGAYRWLPSAYALKRQVRGVLRSKNKETVQIKTSQRIA
jgi:peptidoglycan/xylan/chitin deacetylase (PgdA/CDA1 family)